MALKKNKITEEMPKLEIHWVHPDDLVPYPNNAKVHSETQVRDIAAQIAAFGFDQPIVVQPDTMEIIKGHGRQQAAKHMGLKLVPVIYSDLDQYQAIASRIGDNKVAEAPWDPEKLKVDLGKLQQEGFKIELTGFSLPQMQDFLEPKTSEKIFSEQDHKSVSERKEQYDNSDFRQIILVMDPEQFDGLMKKFAEAQTDLGVETNVEVVEKLFEIYAANRS